MNDHALLATARSAAAQAGALIAAAWAQPRGSVVHKGQIDLVTETDQRAEELIRQALGPTGIPVLGEEAGLEGATALPDTVWVVDPIDGTTNFAHRVPHFAVSIGLWRHGRAVGGVIHQPVTRETWVACAGAATWNDLPIPPLAPVDVEQALLVSGFPYDRRTNPNNNFRQFTHAMMHSRGVLRLGSAALDLAYVASGRIDGFWEPRLKPWDVCAGIALVEAVGGQVCTYEGAPWMLHSDTAWSDSIVAAHPALNAQLRRLVAEAE